MKLNDTFISELDESKPKHWVWVTTDATVNNLRNQIQSRQRTNHQTKIRTCRSFFKPVQSRWTDQQAAPQWPKPKTQDSIGENDKYSKPESNHQRKVEAFSKPVGQYQTHRQFFGWCLHAEPCLSEDSSSVSLVVRTASSVSNNRPKKATQKSNVQDTKGENFWLIKTDKKTLETKSTQTTK